MDKFSERLKAIRGLKKETQKQVFTSIGLKERSYQALEYGEVKPSFDTIIALALHFEISADFLLGLSDDPQRH
jgi:transcriptional regulator with XRE-family HTH domain